MSSEFIDDRTFTISNKKPIIHKNHQSNVKKSVDNEEEETGMQKKTKHFTTEMIDNLINARNIKGISQKDLAKKLNIQVSIIQDLEKNNLPYNMRLYNTIMRTLGVDLHKMKFNQP